MSARPRARCRACLERPGSQTCGGGLLAVFDVGQKPLQIALETSAVIGLEAAQLVDLVLQAGVLLLELGQGAVALVLGLADDLLAGGAGLGDDALTL